MSQEIPLRRLWDPATGALQGFVVHARIGDARKPVPLLLDSGSPGLFLIHRAGRKRGFRPLAERTAFGGGGGKRHRTTRGFFPGLALAELRFRDVLASTTRQELDPTGRYLGLLGLGAFHGYEITLDLARDRLILGPPGDPVEGSTYWTVEGQLLVRAQLTGGRSGLFLFDTGSTRTQVDMSLAERIEGARLGRSLAIRGFGGYFAGARSLEGVEVAFSDVAAGGSLGAIDLSVRSRLAGLQIAGFLGLDMLDGSTVVVDTVGRRIRVIRKGKR